MTDALAELSDVEREGIERAVLEAAWKALSSKLDRSDDDLPSQAIIEALAEAAIAARAAEEEARARFRETRKFFWIEEDQIVCSAYWAWCSGEGIVETAPISVGGTYLSALLVFARVCGAVADAYDTCNEMDELTPSFRGARFFKRLSKAVLAKDEEP